MKAQFLFKGKVHEGEAVRLNHHTTHVQVRCAKMDIMGMRWWNEIKTIKRHNIKHDVKFKAGGKWIPVAEYFGRG